MRSARIACLLLLLGAAPVLGAPRQPIGALPHGWKAPSRVRSTSMWTTLIPGEILVAIDPGSRGLHATGPLRLESVSANTALERFGLDQAERLGPIPVGRRARGPEFYRLTSRRPDFDPRRAAAALRATGAFRAVCPNVRMSLFTLPNDPDIPSQWYVSNSPGTADIELPAAWDVTQGDSSVTIAIIDTGVDTGHPDLAAKIWHNPGEIPGNGIDDDGNGLIDDFQGWDFGMNDNDPNPEYTPEYEPDLEVDVDIAFHGTFCAGIAGAANNNGEGIASAGWKCKIMALKASQPSPGLTGDAVAAAILYAADEGADVISMSFGALADTLDPSGIPTFFQALVDDATNAGSLCVAAAGNSGDSVRTYPAACNDVVAVGATDDTDGRAYFSNFGSWVDVAAPGSVMWSSINRNYELTDIDWIVYYFFFGWDGERPYMFGDGTSFACPLTAGTCGLIRSRFPQLGPRQVAAQLVATGDVVAYDEPIGRKVNAYHAVSTAPVGVEPSPRVAQNLALASAPNPFALATTLRYVLASAGPASLRVYDCSGRELRALETGWQSAGEHVLAWDGRDAQGHAAPSGLYLVRLESGGATRHLKLVKLTR